MEVGDLRLGKPFPRADRFGTDFTDEDRLFFEQVKERAVRDEDVRRMALANTSTSSPTDSAPSSASSWSSAWARTTPS